MLQDWLVNEYAGGAATGLANPNIDGFFIDVHDRFNIITHIYISSIDLFISPIFS